MAQETPIVSWKGPAEKIREPVYRPTTSNSSARVTPAPIQNTHNIDNERPNTPPPYSGPTHSSMLPQPSQTISQPSKYPGLPQLDYTLYHPPSFTLSADHTLLSAYSKPLSRDPWQLCDLVKRLSSVPPKPHVRIVGTSDTGVGFDLKLNLMSLLVPMGDGGEKGRMNYVKVVGDGEMGFRGGTKASVAPSKRSLEEWCRGFCEDSNAIKSFTLHRTITNWDTSHLRGLILSLISSTDWRGRVDVTFPLTHEKVTISAPHKYNSFFSAITEVFTGTKRYEVVKSVWPYANVARGEMGRKCVVQSEEEWFEDWKDAVLYAVQMKRRGWVTVEDRLEGLMEPRKVVGA